LLNADLGLDEAAALRLSPVAMPPASGAPVIAAVGGDESAEFKRQARMLGEAWGAQVAPVLEMPGFNHFTICEEFARADNPLFASAVSLCRRG
jgi:arylformamidase